MTERDGAPGPEQPTWRHRYTGGFGFGGDLSFFFFLLLSTFRVLWRKP